MKYAIIILFFVLQNVFSQDVVSSKQILSKLPIEFKFAGKDLKHRSGKPMASYFSEDKNNTMMLWGEDENITVLGIMMQIVESLSSEQKILAHALLKNIFNDSLGVRIWFDKTLEDFSGGKAKRASQIFKKRIVEVSYYPNMSIFLNIANEGETLKH